MKTRSTTFAGALTRSLRRLKNAFHPAVKIISMPAGVVAHWDVPVRVRDGTVLRVNVFRPENGAAVPAIASAHPYGKDRIPARTRSGRGLDFQYRLFPQPHPIQLSEWTSWEAPDPAVWVPQGYAVVNIDLRGAGTSEGIAELFSDQEALDYYDVIEWIGSQNWCSGRVGLNGRVLSRDQPVQGSCAPAATPCFHLSLGRLDRLIPRHGETRWSPRGRV